MEYFITFSHMYFQVWAMWMMTIYGVFGDFDCTNLWTQYFVDGWGS
jgi:hypothetical protein